MTLLLYPGHVGELEPVQERLRCLHMEEATRRRREIERREAGEVPLDDGAGPLSPLGPYVENHRLDDVRARFVIVDAITLRKLAAREASAFAAVKRVGEGATHDEQNAAVELVFDARREYVRAAVRVVVIGDKQIGGDAGLSGSDLDVLDRNHLLIPLWEAASSFQEVSEKKA